LVKIILPSAQRANRSPHAIELLARWAVANSSLFLSSRALPWAG
jgi:hypothetical protein